jgi:hypothetical protein
MTSFGVSRSALIRDRRCRTVVLLLTGTFTMLCFVTQESSRGCFDAIGPEPGSRCPSLWQLPEWFHPECRGSVLTYRRDISCWRTSEAGVMFESCISGPRVRAGSTITCDDAKGMACNQLQN